MKNRSRNEIIAAILEVINRGESTKAKIMYALSILYTIKWKHIFSAWDGYDSIPKEEENFFIDNNWKRDAFLNYTWPNSRCD